MNALVKSAIAPRKFLLEEICRSNIKLVVLMVGADRSRSSRSGFDHLARTIDSDIKLWTKVLRDAGVKPE